MGTQEMCLADGQKCGPADSCCSPYSRCTWSQYLGGFESFCTPCDLCDPVINNDCVDCPLPSDVSVTHSRCPPEVCTDSTIYDPELFENVVEYCVTPESEFYMNGMRVCVNGVQTITVDGTVNALENRWWDDFYFGQGICSDDVRDFDVVLDDQLHVIDVTITDYESQTSEATDRCCLEESDYSSIITGWEDEIAYMETQIPRYSGTVKTQL